MSRTEYAPSVLERGYHGTYSSVRAHDGDPATAWRSHPETDFPAAQWIYLDLGEKRCLDAVEVTWGGAAGRSLPYARKFDVETWDPAQERQWMVYGAPSDGWIARKRGVKGTGGTQTVRFPQTETQYVRLRLRESSAGPRGTYAVAEFRALCGGEPLPLAGWIPCVASSTFVASSGHDDRKIFGFEEYMDFLRSFDPPAEPLVIVNFGTDTPEEAAAWVHYANRVKGYGIRYWEIGNEMNGHWESGGPLNATDYARRYLAFYDALKAADPSITVIAMAEAHSTSLLHDGHSYLEAFLDRLAEAERLDALDAVSYHQYPNWGQPVRELLASPAAEVAEGAAAVRRQLSRHVDPDRVDVWLTEFNTSDQVKPHDISVRLENALWLAQYLPEFAKNYGLRGWAQLWNVMNGGNAIHDPRGGDHGYLQAEEGPWQHQERADYWTMILLTNHWSRPGDREIHRMVAVEGGHPMLAAYANLRPDGKLALLAVNRDPDREITASLELRGFDPEPLAERWTFDSSNYRWRTDAKPYHADPSKPPTARPIRNAGKSTKLSFPPFSITVVRFAPRKG